MSEREATRIAYEEIPLHRIDRTSGDYPIPQSPFKTPDALVEAMDKFTEKRWFVSSLYHGGNGQRPCLGNTSDIYLVYIWRDASGGWHPERKVGANWLPDLDLLDKLIEASKPQEFDAEPACGNVRAEEADYYAHPD